jgi:flagellar hook-associated protein 3 FlgL
MSSWGRIYDNLMSGLSRHWNEMTRIQEQIASGSRVLRVSDDPAAGAEIIALQRRSRSLDSYAKNLDRLTLDLELSSAVTQEVSTSLVRAQQLLEQGATGTYSSEQRAAIAEEINALLDDIVMLANTEVTGRYLFGGDGAASPPYVAQREDGRIVAVRYVGGPGELSVPVSPGSVYPGPLTGGQVFHADGRREPVLLGSTGAAAGRGTSSVRGDVWLTFTHAQTSYAGTTGVAAGASSADGDTILGANHTLTIYADEGMVRLDDGEKVAYDAMTDNDLRLENAAGDVAYVDMTNLAGGLSGTVSVTVTATGQATIDDGQTVADLTTFTDNEAVTDAEGRVLYIDARFLARTGTEPVRVPGTYDVFGALIGTRDLLLNERDLAEPQQLELLQDSLASLKEAAAAVTAAITTAGARLEAVDSIRRRQEDVAVDLDARTSTLQDADVIQLATELARVQTHYEMMLAASARLLDLSLLDYVR